jgi:hypothetical protein
MISFGFDPGSRTRALTPGERLVVCTLRRLAQDADVHTPGAVFGLHDVVADLASAEQLFRAFLAEARTGGGVREPILARAGCPSLTKDECRLLRAVAAARAGDEALLDNYLYKLALDPSPRARLAEAVRALAAALAAQKDPPPTPDARQPVPAPVLAVARARGWALDGLAVAWPARPTVRGDSPRLVSTKQRHVS